MASACRPKSWTWAAISHFSVNGQPRQVPLGDVVLLDFAGDGRNVTLEESEQSQRGQWRLRGHEKRRTVQRLAAGPHGQAADRAVLERPQRNLSDVARIYTGSVSNVAGFPTPPPAVAPNTRCRKHSVGPRPRTRPWRDGIANARPRRPTLDRSSCRRTCSGRTPASRSAAVSICGSSRPARFGLSINGDDIGAAAVP